MEVIKTHPVLAATERRFWRLNNLYHIVDEQSNDIIFSLVSRDVLLQLYKELWYWNLILKSRQHGITTEVDLFILDMCLFNDNIHAGIIAHNLKDAQRIFQTKIRYPYEHLPAALKESRRAEKAEAMELRLSNGSMIWVGTSMRSATVRLLHISEHGKICAKYPEKAKEIKTGALPALHEGSFLFVESTAEGSAGDFYNMAVESQAITAEAKRNKRQLNKQQMRFHFFPWFKHPTNRTNPVGINISDELKRYFTELESKEPLSQEQRAWYALKRDGPGGLSKDMKREHPSTVDEAFAQAIEGAVYGDELECAREEGRIGWYPHEERELVYTFWDMGYRDATAVIFAQFIQERIHIIDFYHQVGRGATYHARQVKQKPYVFRDHYPPHDIMNHEQGTGIILKDIYDSLLETKMKPIQRPKYKAEGIALVRSIFNKLFFHSKTTQDLIKALTFYRYEWDENAVQFKKDPFDDWTNDAADALQTLAIAYTFHIRDKGQLIGYPHVISTQRRLKKGTSAYRRRGILEFGKNRS